MKITNQMENVVKVCYKDNCTTGFEIEYKNHRYLLTVKHLLDTDNNGVNNAEQSSKFDFTINGEPKECFVLFHKNPMIDMLIIEYEFSEKIYDYPILSPDGVMMGQEVMFLGYPYGMIQKMYNSEIDYPLVKHAHLSGEIHDESSSLFILDGNNNPGFSGGPVYFVNEETRKLHILSIINGYRFNKSFVCTAEDTQSELYVKENTGIIFSTNILYAIEIIEQNVGARNVIKGVKC